MLLSYGAIASVFASVAFAQTLASELALIPPCGFTCLTASVQDAGCSLTDYACPCGAKRSAIITAASPCIVGNCSVTDALTTQKIANEICVIALDNSTSSSSSSYASTASSAIESSSTIIRTSSASTSTSSVNSSTTSKASSSSSTIPTTTPKSSFTASSTSSAAAQTSGNAGSRIKTARTIPGMAILAALVL